MPRPRIRHLLVIRSSAMGDVAMTVRLISALVKRHHTLKVTLLTKPAFAPFFADIPNVTVKQLDTENAHKGVRGLWLLFKELKGEKIDAVADLHNVLRSNILKVFFKLNRIPFQQIDKGRAEKKALTREKAKVFKPLTTTHQRYVDVVKRLGLSVKPRAYDVLDKKELSSEASSLLGEKQERWVGIAPFAKHEGKQYPINRVTDIIEILNKREDINILLFGGGAKEVELLSAIAEKYTKVTCIAGKFSFKDELAIISQLDTMMAMDSGNGHIAAMYGVPVITVWGVTHPYAGFTPFNQPTENQILPDLEEFPLVPTSVFGDRCPNGYENVMKSILPETIIERLDKILKDSA